MSPINKNVLVVFGATGQQGGSVVDFVLNDPELSEQFTIRAFTRKPKRPAALALAAKGVEIVEGDCDDRESLARVMKEAHTVFAVTASIYDDDQTRVREVAQGKAIADAAVTAGVKYYVYSTCPRVSEVSGGKYTKCDHFDGKADVEDYIRSLSPALKSSFYSPGSFMQNLSNPQMMKPRRLHDGTYAFSSNVPADTVLPLVDVVADTGKYVGAILAEPAKFEGKIIRAASELITFEEIAKVLSRLSGKEVKYYQMEEILYRAFAPADAGDMQVEMMWNMHDFGYYGAETKEFVSWAGQHARGKLTTFEEYAENKMLPL
ncbi:hypothetical protein BGZ83_009008 [Gryganskiella cystojenkinii]|nr:hypothetical protein BGZ83_009008 [Gryganskiella cystojenkinii]